MQQYMHQDAQDALRICLTEVLALLRAQRWNYETCHWQVHGDAFYGDHQLFERLYNNLGQEIDTLAEKIVGLLGDPTEGDYPFSNESQAQTAQAWLGSWAIYTCPHRRSLRSEQDLQRALKKAYDILKSLDALTLGLDDFLMSLASAHDSHTYLLRQRIAQRDMDRLASSQLRFAWFSLKAEGVERRDQDPDYREYVKRKRDQGEKALNRSEWEDWVEGKSRPDTRKKFDEDGKGPESDEPAEKPRPKKKLEEISLDESPEAIKREQDKEKEDSSVSEHDQALVDKYLGKGKSKVRQRIVGLLNKLKDRNVTKWLSEVDNMTDEELNRQVEDLKKRMGPKVEEEMQEEVEAKGSTEIRDLIPDEKAKRQFAENLAKNLPDEVAKGRPPSFLAFAIEHILDSMLEFAGKPEGTETAMEKRKRYQDYSKKHDQAKTKLEDQQSQLDEANKEWDEATKALDEAKKELAEAEKKLDDDDPKLQKLKDKVEEGESAVSDAYSRSRSLTKNVQDSVKEISRLTEDQAMAGPSSETEREIAEGERTREDKETERARQDEEKSEKEHSEGRKKDKSDKAKSEREEKNKQRKEERERKRELKERRKPKTRKIVDYDKMDVSRLEAELKKLNKEKDDLTGKYNKLVERDDRSEEDDADMDRHKAERAAVEKEITQVQKKLTQERKKGKKAGLRLLFSADEPPEEKADFGEFFDELARQLIRPDEETIEKSLQSMVDEQGKKAAQEFRRQWFAKTPVPSPMTAESYFFDNPEHREVKQFYDSGALSNIIPAERAKGPPPTKTDIKRMPGGHEFSTLTRYVVDTDEPGVTGVPRGREELPKHPRLAGWTFAPKR